MNGRNARTPNVGPGNGLRADRFRNLAVPGAPFLPSCSIGLLRLVVVILGVGLNNKGQVALAIAIAGGPDTIVLLTPTTP
jgi:hypothetical protein